MYAFQSDFWEVVKRLAPETEEENGEFNKFPVNASIESASEKLGQEFEDQSEMCNVTYHKGGTTTKLRAGLHPTVKRQAATRGKITDFTRAARRRLLDALNSINRGRLVCKPLFITLTYPQKWPSKTEVWKANLDTFGKRLVRRFSDAAFYWKLEFQQRGAPHFHLLLFNVPYMAHDWLARAWFEVVDSGEPAHLKAGTEVRRIRSWRGVLSYAAKYMVKAVQLPLFGGPPLKELLAHYPGRFWGCVNRGKLPIDVVALVLTWQEFYRLRRAIWKYKQSQGFGPRFTGRYQGCHIYLEQGVLERLITHILLTC
jgi:hypothetical protein